MPANTTGAFSITSGQANVLGMIKGGTAFDRSIMGAGGIGGVQGNFGVCAGHFTTLSSPAVTATMVGAGLTLAAVTGVAGQFAAVSAGALTDMTAHLANHFDNFAQNLNLYTSSLGVQQGLQKVGSSLAEIGDGDICAGLYDFFGSIMGLGAQIIGQIAGLIGSVVALLAGLVNDIMTAVVTITQAAIDAIAATIQIALEAILEAAAALSAMISAELALFAKILADLLDFGAMFAFLSLFLHPCAKLAIMAVGNPAFIAALSH